MFSGEDNVDFIQLHKLKIILDLNTFLKDDALKIYAHRFILLAHFNMLMLVPKLGVFTFGCDTER